MTRQAFCRVLLVVAAIVVLSGHSLPISRAVAQGLSDVWTWVLASPGGLGTCQPLTGCDNVRIASLAAYNGQLFAGTENALQGAEIWQYDGTSWTRQIQGDFDNGQNTSIVSLAPYAGLLYAGTQGGDSGAELWAYNGITWTRALTGGFDQSRLPSDPKNIAATALASFNNKLYVGTRYDYNGAEIWAYNGITATQVVSAGLANTDNVAVLTLAVFNNKLYAGTLAPSGGGELWRSSNGVDWERVANASGGFGDLTNVGISSLAVMSGTLYAGTLHYDATGTEIWSSSDGTNWTLALGNGFGNTALYEVNALLPYQGMLYAAVSSAQSQAEIWAYDGQGWQRALSSPPQANGQAHSFSEARSLAVLNNLLYLGTSQVSIGSSASGPEVWRTGSSAAGTATATSTPSRTATATPSSTVTPPASATSTRTPSLTPSWTATATGTRTPTVTSTWTATASRTATAMPSPTSTLTPTRTVSATPSLVATGTATATATVSETPKVTTTPTATAAPRFLIFLPLIIR